MLACRERSRIRFLYLVNSIGGIVTRLRLQVAACPGCGLYVARRLHRRGSRAQARNCPCAPFTRGWRGVSWRRLGSVRHERRRFEAVRELRGGAVSRRHTRERESPLREGAAYGRRDWCALTAETSDFDCGLPRCEICQCASCRARRALVSFEHVAALIRGNLAGALGRLLGRIGADRRRIGGRSGAAGLARGSAAARSAAGAALAAGRGVRKAWTCADPVRGRRCRADHVGRGARGARPCQHRAASPVTARQRV